MDVMFVNDAGIETILEAELGIAPSKFATGKIRCFQNNVTCSHATLLSALTESTFPGYADISLSSASWNAVTVTAHIANTTPVSPFAFVCTGGTAQPVYGWYVTDSSGTLLLACCTFASGPYVVVNSGDTVNVAPTMTEDSVN
jgi:hypothetical protein